MRDERPDERHHKPSKCREQFCDVLVQVNALLPCVVVYWTLKVVKSAWLAVILYESVCLVGLPWLTLMLRGGSSSRRTLAVTRLRPLVQSLIRPKEWRRCAAVTTGSVLTFGAGGFFAYLALAKREFDDHDISKAISRNSTNTGLHAGSATRDLALVFLGVWFCTVNPVLEELFWRGYLYSELGRILNGSSSRGGSSEGGGSSSSDAPPRGETRTTTEVVVEASASSSSSSSSTRFSAVLQCAEQTELSRWLTSVYFGSFHGVVVFVFVDYVAAALVWLFLAACSRCWIWLAERPAFGFPFIVAFHAGPDQCRSFLTCRLVDVAFFVLKELSFFRTVRLGHRMLLSLLFF